jgi:hypothetical protein
MDEIYDDGGPAFPVSEEAARGKVAGVYGGMTQRALMATILMHSELTTCGVPGEACEALIRAAADSGREPEYQMAHNAVQCADALLAALSAPKPDPLTYLDRSYMKQGPMLVQALRDIAKGEAMGDATEKLRAEVSRLLHIFDDDIPF